MRIFTQGAIHFLACPALLQHIIARASRAQKIATNLEAIGAHRSTALLLLLDELPGGVGGGDGLGGPDDRRVADGGGGESGNDGLLDCGGDHGCGLKLILLYLFCVDTSFINENFNVFTFIYDILGI